MKLCSSGPAPTVSTGLKSESRMFHSSSKPEVPLLKLDLSAASRARRYFSANLEGKKDMEAPKDICKDEAFALQRASLAAGRSAKSSPLPIARATPARARPRSR